MLNKRTKITEVTSILLWLRGGMVDLRAAGSNPSAAGIVDVQHTNKSIYITVHMRVIFNLKCILSEYPLFYNNPHRIKTSFDIPIGKIIAKIYQYLQNITSQIIEIVLSSLLLAWIWFPVLSCCATPAETCWFWHRLCFLSVSVTARKCSLRMSLGCRRGLIWLMSLLNPQIFV